jgi:hypothetical protein
LASNISSFEKLCGFYHFFAVLRSHIAAAEKNALRGFLFRKHGQIHVKDVRITCDYL